MIFLANLSLHRGRTFKHFALGLLLAFSLTPASFAKNFKIQVQNNTSKGVRFTYDPDDGRLSVINAITNDLVMSVDIGKNIEIGKIEIKPTKTQYRFTVNIGSQAPRLVELEPDVIKNIRWDVENLPRMLGRPVSPATETPIGFQDGMPSDPREAAEWRIERARELQAKTREALADIHGQSEAIQALAQVGASLPTQRKYRVIELAGPDSTGRRTSAEKAAGAFYPETKKPFYYFDLSQQTEPKFLETLFKGSPPGYIGSATASGPMAWLLNHPDGGIIYLDNFQALDSRGAAVIQSFLSSGQMVVPPSLLQALVKPLVEAQKPKEEWPVALQMAAREGLDKELVLELSPRHLVMIGTSDGTEIFHGKGSGTNAGRRLQSAQDIAAANLAFNEESVRRAQRDRGIGDDVLNAIGKIIVFKAIEPDAHEAIVQSELDQIAARVHEDYHVELNFNADARAYLYQETFTPLAGAKFIVSQLQAWLSDRLDQAVIEDQSIRPGQKVYVKLVPGDPDHRARFALHLENKSGAVSTFEVGKLLPVRPQALLDRLKQNLMRTLKKNLIGHDEELQQVHDQIIAQVAETVYAPKDPKNAVKKRRVAVITLDGSSGIGKTEIAKAVNEAAFDDPDSLLNINMNSVSSVSTFNRDVVAKMRSHIKTHPSALVGLLDEWVRAGDDYSRPAIQNILLSVIDEGILPPVDDEIKTVDGMPKRDNSMVELPEATILILTSNIFNLTLGAGSERLTNRELMAHARMARRHPEKLKAAYEQLIPNAALRSRLPEPILMLPNDDEQLAGLRQKFFREAMAGVTAQGVQVELGASAEQYLIDDYIAIRGARWLAITLNNYFKSPLLTLVAMNQTRYAGATVTIQFDPATRALGAEVKLADGSRETRKLTVIPKSRADFDMENKQKEAWKTDVHEWGHIIARAASYGPDSIAEVNTFGGGDGGWMESATDVPGETGYLTTLSGPLRLATLLGGHIAEEIFFGQSGNGASMDYKMAREAALTMIRDGSLPGPPIPLLPNPSQRMLELIEFKTWKLTNYAYAIARFNIENNRELLEEGAQALQATPDGRLDRAQIRQILEGKLKQVTPADLERIKKETDAQGAFDSMGASADPWGCEKRLTASP